MLTGAKLIRTGMPTDQLKRRKLAKIREQAYAAVGTLWFNNILPKHFEEGADMLYDYRPRSPRYIKRKKRLAARGLKYKNKPLQFTGTTKNMATSRARIVATGNQCTVSYNVPAYIGPYGKSKFIGEEMQRLSKRDEQALQRAFDKEMGIALEEDTTQVLVKIG